jgi:hypothetical protein
MTDDPQVELPFMSTRQYRFFAEFCDDCARHRYIGLCYGASGLGKTESGRQYAQWDTIESIQTALAESRRRGTYRPEDDYEPLSLPVELLDCRTVFYTPAVMNSAPRVAQGVRELRHHLTSFILQARDRHGLTSTGAQAVRDHTRLLIVDEADRLTVLSLEQLREIYDQGGLGLVLIGMPGIEKRLSRYAQFYSRVGFVHKVNPLKGKELDDVLQQHCELLGLIPEEATAGEVMAAIVRTTSGNFRLIKRLFTQIARVMKNNQLDRITPAAVQYARESLVIGT